MKFNLKVSRVDGQCAPKVLTIDVFLDIDIWLCITVEARFFVFSWKDSWSIHLV